MNWCDMDVALQGHLGSDLDVVNAARVSFAKASYDFDERDTKLIYFLARNNHWTPFAHCFARFRVKVPIFVARQWFKHTVGFSYNEVSRRYVSDEPELMRVNYWRSRPDESIKQGSSGRLDYVSDDTIELLETMVAHYNRLIREGVAPEMARLVLPQNVMTEFVVSGSLAAWARFYNLRSDDHAQKEIQECAEVINTHMSKLFYESWKALTNGKVN